METLVFLCNGEEYYDSHIGQIQNKQLPALIKNVIASGSYYKTEWSAWNSKFIQVGDRAYLTRSGNTGNNPSGFIAAGHVIAAPENRQLRRLGGDYSSLSAAYVDDDDGRFFVCIQLDSVVDFDVPLEQKTLAKLSKFKGVNFNFGRGGARFDSKAAPFLDCEWDKHSLIQQRQARGRRLIDVFLERGNSFKENKEYQSAIDTYELALKIDPNYQKALSQIKICRAFIAKAEPVSTTIIDALAEVSKTLNFTPKDSSDARQKTLISIASRQGQYQFRQILLQAYKYRCAITGFDADVALEAAHIIPYVETQNNAPSNGLLLRADLHTLFDLNLIAINPDSLQINLAPSLQTTEYRSLQGKQLRIPEEEALQPNKQFLQRHFELCCWKKLY